MLIPKTFKSKKVLQFAYEDDWSDSQTTQGLFPLTALSRRVFVMKHYVFCAAGIELLNNTYSVH